jgi:prophage antirepressor-like protein/predicted GIY-YIG superfamily endonuclease
MAKTNDTTPRPVRGKKRKYSSELAYVYVIEDDTGLIKTGHSENPTRRLKQIQRTCGFNIIRRHFSPLCYNFAQIEEALQTEFSERLKQEEYVQRASFEAVCAVLDKQVFQTELTTKSEQNLTPFQFQTYTIRIVFGEQVEFLFVAKDVCQALGIKKYRDAIVKLDADERMSMIVDTLGGRQKMTCVNESGLYSLIFMSNKPEAKAFKRWVTHEVLPQIRRQGYYNLYGEANPSTQSLVNEVAQAVLDKITNALVPLTKNPVISVETQANTVEKIQVSFQVKLSFEIKEE